MIVGIDPGVSGAVVVLSAPAAGSVVRCEDMPTLEVNGRRCVDASALASMLRGMDGITHVVVEHVQGVQQSGATSAFAFGRGFGTIEGVLAGLTLPHTLVRPQRWTKDLGVGSDKGTHRATAKRLWPAAAETFARVKDDGRADAALLAWWWARHGSRSVA